MSKTDIWMPWHIGPYLADTMHLSTLEHGAYDLLLLHGWRNEGKIVDDDKLLARVTKLPLDQWRAIRPTLQAFFSAFQDPMLGACWVQKRQMEELVKAKEQKDKAETKARNAAQKRWGSSSKHSTSKAQALHVHGSSPTPRSLEEIPPTPRDFFPGSPLPSGGGRFTCNSPEVEAVYDAYPKERKFADGRVQRVKFLLLDKDRIAAFMNRNPAYPLLEAVKLLPEATSTPPDLGNFLDEPWAIETLRKSAPKETVYL